MCRDKSLRERDFNTYTSEVQCGKWQDKSPSDIGERDKTDGHECRFVENGHCRDFRPSQTRTNSHAQAAYTSAHS
jgi:hypothetical protein